MAEDGGNRPSGSPGQVEEERRLQLVTEQYLRLLNVEKTIQACEAQGMKRRTVERYLAKMRERFAKVSEAKHEEMVGYYRELLRDLIADARQAGNRNAIAQYVRLAAEIDGVRVHRVAVSKDDDLSGLSQEDIDAIDAIYKKNGK